MRARLLALSGVVVVVVLAAAGLNVRLANQPMPRAPHPAPAISSGALSSVVAAACVRARSPLRLRPRSLASLSSLSYRPQPPPPPPPLPAPLEPGRQRNQGCAGAGGTSWLARNMPLESRVIAGPLDALSLHTRNPAPFCKQNNPHEHKLNSPGSTTTKMLLESTTTLLPDFVSLSGGQIQKEAAS